MSRIIDELNKESIINIVKAMLANGKLSHEEIAECSGLTVEEVKKLTEGKSA